MKCLNCGKEINEDAAFCPHCGAKVELKVTEEVNEPAPEVEEKKSKKAPGKKAKIGIIAGVIGVLLAVAVIILISLMSRNSMGEYFIETKHFNHSLVGADDYGYVSKTAFECIDTEKLYCDMFGVSEAELEQLLEMDAASDYEYFYKELRDSYVNISYVTPTDDLSNGDTVTLRAVVNYDAINNMYGVKHKLHGSSIEEKSYTVEGLQEPVEFDPFSQIEYVAADPDGQHYITHYDTENDTVGKYIVGKSDTENWKFWDSSTGEIVATYQLKSESESGSPFLPGDKVTYSLVGEKDQLARYGIIFSETTKTYTLKKWAYATKKSQVSVKDAEKFLELVKKYTGQEPEVATLYFTVAIKKNASAENYFDVVTKQTYGESTYYKSYSISNVIVDEDGVLQWGDDFYSVNSGSTWDTVSDYKEHYADHDGDSYKAYDITSLLKGE